MRLPPHFSEIAFVSDLNTLPDEVPPTWKIKMMSPRLTMPECLVFERIGKPDRTESIREICIMQAPNHLLLCKHICNHGFWQHRQRINHILERDLLPLKNSSWLDDSEKPLNRVQFLRKLKMSAIEIASNGAYECIFVDGDLFGGHDLIIRGSLKLGPETADLHG